jgi:hypothetical protein
MKADPEDFRRQYASLNDEALLAIERDELVPVAQVCYDAELAARGLKAAAEETGEAAAAGTQEPLENPVEIAEFANPAEAVAARSLLRFAEIPCMLSSDLPMSGSAFQVLANVKLYVPSEYAEEAAAVLDSELSDEELAAQAEAAVLEEEDAEESRGEDEFKSEA